jgi:sulfur-carrier protein
MPNATVRYWAAAQAKAGVAQDTFSGQTIQELIDQILTHRPDVEGVLTRSSFLLDGVAVHDRSASVNEGSILEVLPPFAGG